jgi:hypothetical protein
LMTGWAKVTTFTGKGQQVFMTAIFALDPGKAVEEISAIQIPVHNLFDMGAKEAVHPFKTIFSGKGQAGLIFFP